VDRPAIATAGATQRFQLNDQLYVSVPRGLTDRLGDRYLAYLLGKAMGPVGQLVLPTAILQIESIRSGQPAIARIGRQFGEVRLEQRRVPAQAAIEITRIPQPMTGGVTEYALPTAGSAPSGIVAGPDGALWFIEALGNNIGRITTNGAISEYPIPTPRSLPYAIAAGPDGALWFSESGGNKIGRITTAGGVREFPVPTPASGPNGVAPGADGAVWFTEFSADKIGRITSAGIISEYPLPAPAAGPGSLTAGPDGAMWFSEYSGNSIGRIGPRRSDAK